MRRTEQDTYMLEQAQRGIDRLDKHTTTNPFALILLQQALALLASIPGALEQAIQRAEAEGVEDHRAAATLRDAREDCDDAYEGLHLSLKAHIFNVRAGDRAAGERLEQERRRFGGGSPSTFAALTAERALNMLQQAVTFGDSLLGAEHPAQIQAGIALNTLREARRQADKEAGESLQARNALDRARDDARRAYRAARCAFEAALILDGIEDQLDRYLLSHRRRAASTRTDTPEAPSTPAPPSPDTPEG